MYTKIILIKILKMFLTAISLIIKMIVQLFFNRNHLKIEHNKNDTQIIINVNFNNLNFIK